METQPRCCALGKIKEAQDQGVEFWQTKSFEIMTFFTTPGDCIDRVAAQDGDRVLFGQLATPRPAPKVTLKSGIGKARSSNSSSQQQPISHTDVPSLWKERTTWESKAEVQDDSKHIKEADQATRNLGHTASDIIVDTQQLYSRKSGEGEDGV